MLALLLVVLALRGFLRLRSTTLGPPCLWTAISAASLAVGVLLETQLKGISLSAFRFAVAATTLCPLMAVLGAKRPQDRGWQWVVFTLWIVLIWPALQAVLLPAGVDVELFVAWKIFLWGLIGLGLLNYLPTRHWRAAILIAMGQVLLLRDYLGLNPSASPAWDPLVATACLLAAAGLTPKRDQQSAPRDSPFATHDATWLSFRDNYGAFWALRILGRVNQTAQSRNWPLELTWSGFVPQPSNKLAADQLEELQQTLDSLFRRFTREEKQS